MFYFNVLFYKGAFRRADIFFIPSFPILLCFLFEKVNEIMIIMNQTYEVIVEGFVKENGCSSADFDEQRSQQSNAN